VVVSCPLKASTKLDDNWRVAQVSTPAANCYIPERNAGDIERDVVKVEDTLMEMNGAVVQDPERASRRLVRFVGS
jgi:hypothetical protein